jgi:drug/metabolite transporter, DME family
VRLRGERDVLSATQRAIPAIPAIRRGPALVLLGAMLWGTAGASQALLDGAIPPVVVGALRTVIAGIALGALASRGLRSSLRQVAAVRARAVPLLAVGGLCTAGYQAAFFVGVRSLGIAVGTILAVGSAPFFAGALALLRGRGRPSRLWVGTTSLAVAGLTLLVRPQAGVELSVPGATAALSAGLAFGVFTVVSKELLDLGVRRLDTVAVPFLIGGLVLVPVLAVGLLRADGAHMLLRPQGVLVVLWLGVGATAVGYLLFIAGLGSVPAVVGTTLALAEPLTATLLGVTLFGERLGGVATVGALAVVGALLLTAARPEVDPARPVADPAR